MMIEQNKELSEFIANGSVSSSVTVNSAIYHEYSLQDYPINSQCSNEDDSSRTFLLNIYPPLLKDAIGGLPGEPTRVFASKVEDQGEFTQHYRACCTTCGEFHFDLLLEVKMKRERYDHGKKTRHTTSIKKLAHFPEPPVKEIGKELKSLLNSNAVNIYSKALKLRKVGYGIGAYAYLRRVIEALIRELSQDFESTHVDQLIKSIYSDLPESLRQGDNPIKLLWEQFSSGLHGLTDEECLAKVEHGIQIMTWIIKEIYSERNEGKMAKEAIIKMRNGEG